MVASFDVSSREVAAVCSPPQAWASASPADRSRQHDLLVSNAHAANRNGSTLLAASLFWQAARLEPNRVSTLLSYVNMRLKSGEHALAAACYLRLLETRSLNPREWEFVTRKLAEANEAMVAAKEGERAAVTIQKIARAASARACLSSRLLASRSARIIQRACLPPANRSHLPFVEQLSLLYLPERGNAQATWEGVESIVACAHPALGARGRPISAAALAPFAALAFRPVAPSLRLPIPPQPAAALHFAVTRRDGCILHCCALPLPQPAGRTASLRGEGEVLVLAGRHYLPHQMRECAEALLPLAVAAAEEKAEERQRQMQRQGGPERQKQGGTDGQPYVKSRRDVKLGLQISVGEGGVRAHLVVRKGKVDGEGEESKEGEENGEAPCEVERDGKRHGEEVILASGTERRSSACFEDEASLYPSTASLRRAARQLIAQPAPRLRQGVSSLRVADREVRLKIPPIARSRGLSPPVEPLANVRRG